MATQTQAQKEKAKQKRLKAKEAKELKELNKIEPTELFTEDDSEVIDEVIAIKDIEIPSTEVLSKAEDNAALFNGQPRYWTSKIYLKGLGVVEGVVTSDQYEAFISQSKVDVDLNKWLLTYAERTAKTALTESKLRKKNN